MTDADAPLSKVPFVDLRAQYRTIQSEIRQALDNVLESTEFILGEAVDSFERAFAAYLGVRHAVGVGSGLDALRLALQAARIGAGDQVICPANTYIATALAISGVGATPVLVDCLEDTHQIDPKLTERAITRKTKAIMPVHLYGQAADMASLSAIADAHRLQVIEDAAQAHGATFEGRLCGAFGNVGCFSFYPGKNLGAYGDAGCVVTNDDDLAERVRQLRNYGQRAKYEHVCKGANSRLDSVQAAILSVKLRHLNAWNALRQAHAKYYSERLAGTAVGLPKVEPRSSHVFHLYVIRAEKRNPLREHLRNWGVDTGIHYPTPIHLQAAYQDLGYETGAFPMTEQLAREVLSLPMFPELSRPQMDRVIEAIASFEK